MDNEQRGPEPVRSRRKKIMIRPRTDYPRRSPDHREEYAAEVSPLPVRDRSPEVKESAEADDAYKPVGYASVGLGIASLIIWPIILGPLAAVLGYYAYSNGRKTAGAWGLGMGIVAVLSYFVMIPFAR
ncbi:MULTISPECIES: hypothetical protein [Paenibacillus]|uniref:hypothetical protein n=1 Tax=Paenibacillus TaxID=44249 RepID=UPI001F205DC7|nr:MULTISPECIES: hypothetical protein [Paenibacillus]